MNDNTRVLPKNKKPTAEHHLTDREIEYLSLAAIGYKNYEIAKALSVTNSTVKKTLETVFQKLFAKDRANAVALAFIHDILNIRTINKIIKKYNLKKVDLL